MVVQDLAFGLDEDLTFFVLFNDVKNLDDSAKRPDSVIVLIHYATTEVHWSTVQNRFVVCTEISLRRD